MAVEMKVKALAIDADSNTFIVLLSNPESRYTLPIWIGPFEANAIAMKLKHKSLHRPMTHDLIRNIIEAFDSEIAKIEVMDLRDNTYYAMIYLVVDGREITIDARPSDAIAVALATGAPIYVREKVLYKSKTLQLDEDMDESHLEEYLESLDPEDFKYKM